ncbi:hypothetical protein yrohd0001_29160 [Yersinia rohdei ATCC 43380]|nr:hypothetical protein yrohd0001_29160 [Yersinia rohdei ATCC 43380]
MVDVYYSIIKKMLNKVPDLNIKKLVAAVGIIAVCCLFYLLALDSYCDQGGSFSTGICAITSIIPW